MAEQLAIYKKGSTDLVAAGDPATGVAITGLTAGTVVTTGDYQAAKYDGNAKKNTSGLVDVPGFTVLGGTPKDVTSTPTGDGATVTGK
ncbi:hypothetical protein [Levilactobacillus yonginensis]|uniref:hypothetical protein n=1 Tax=Levilactobacillus yonginensis TaxID=1054041 RepID=UPI00345D6A85